MLSITEINGQEVNTQKDGANRVKERLGGVETECERGYGERERL